MSNKVLWKAVEGFEGYYEVSNDGQVRSLDRWVEFIRKGTVCERFFEGKVLKPKTDKDGYKEVCLKKGSLQVHRRVHRLVAYAFIEGYEEWKVVDHKNSIKDDNRYENLQWISNTENVIKYYSEEAGLGRTLSSLSRLDWLYIGFLYTSGLEYKAIAANLGLSCKSVDSIWDGLSGRRLSSITGFKKGDFMKRKHPTTKLDPDTVADIIEDRLDNKLLLRELAEKYGIAESMVSRFCSGKRQPEGLRVYKQRLVDKGSNHDNITGEFN